MPLRMLSMMAISAANSATLVSGMSPISDMLPLGGGDKNPGS